MMLKSKSFFLTVPNRTSNLGKDLSLQSLEVYSCIQKKIGLLILLNCEAVSLTVFTTMSNRPVIIRLLKTTVLSLKYLINLAYGFSLGDVFKSFK